MADVVHDDWLQRESGDALWSSAQHALIPGLLRYKPFVLFVENSNPFHHLPCCIPSFRFSGFCVLMASIGLGKIMMNPY